jgi:hypothetical protein
MEARLKDMREHEALSKAMVGSDGPLDRTRAVVDCAAIPALFRRRGKAGRKFI